MEVGPVVPGRDCLFQQGHYSARVRADLVMCVDFSLAEAAGERLTGSRLARYS